MRDAVRVAVMGGLFLFLLAGWALGGIAGAAAGLGLGLAVFVLPFRRLPLWSWAALYFGRRSTTVLADPVTVTNDRTGGGVRYQDDVVIAALQLLGKAYRPTLFTGATSTVSDNTIDLRRLLPLMHQSLGLTINSLNVVSTGCRRRNTGDYPRVYDSLIGTSPYAGQRDVWLIVRINARENGEALQWRATAGAAALAAAQRIASALRTEGIRAKVATAAEITQLDQRLGASALGLIGRAIDSRPRNSRWHSVRGDSGWLTTYAYQPRNIDAQTLAQVWSLRADGITQTVTLFPDGTVCASATVRTPQPPTASPSTTLQTLPGEQVQALTNTLCAPTKRLRGQAHGVLPPSLHLPIGPSGVLIGKLSTGDRLLLPLRDPGEFSTILIAAQDSIAIRMIIRSVASGERITLHTKDLARWDSVRMPNLMVTDQPRPAPGTTVSVVDGSITPTPRPNVVLHIEPRADAGRRTADVVIAQTGPATVEVRAGGEVHDVEVELFRAENRYVYARQDGYFDLDRDGATELQMAE